MIIVRRNFAQCETLKVLKEKKKKKVPLATNSTFRFNCAVFNRKRCALCSTSLIGHVVR